MVTVGVETESIGACEWRFAGFPEPPPAAPIFGDGPVRAAATRVSTAWRGADAAIAGDEMEFVARVRRTVALYGEADAALASRGRVGGN